RVSSWRSGQGTEIRWKAGGIESGSALLASSLSNTQYDRYFVPMPDCLLGGQQAGSFRIDLPVYHFRQGYNEYLQFAFAGGEAAGSIAGALELRAAGGGMSADLSAQDREGRWIKVSVQNLGRCE